MKTGAGRVSSAAQRLFSTLKPAVVICATGDEAIDSRIAELARSSGALVCVVDTPHLNDFNMPAIGKVGDIRVAVATGGMSPAMASIIRKRVEKMLTRQDVLQVKLQDYLRRATKERLKEASARREFVYRIINSPRIAELLRWNKYGEARRLAMKMLLAEER